jgi:hypothetical protein
MHDTARDRIDANGTGPGALEGEVAGSASATARTAIPDDAAAIARIYNEGIEDRTATFETRPRTASDIAAWFDGRHPIVGRRRL